MTPSDPACERPEFELVVYAPPATRPVLVGHAVFRDEDSAWRARLREHLAAGQELSIDLSEWGLGVVHDEAEDVKRSRSALLDPGAGVEIVGRWPVDAGADLLWTTREVRLHGRRVVWSLCDVVVDKGGMRAPWRVRAADCRLLASYGLLTRVRGVYRHTPIGRGVRAVLLGAACKIAPKILKISACTPL